VETVLVALTLYNRKIMQAITDRNILDNSY
jgi:hypothetical protein